MPARRRDAEDGTSALTATFAVAAFLSFLLLAAQVLVHLVPMGTSSHSSVTSLRSVTVRG